MICKPPSFVYMYSFGCTSRSCSRVIHRKMPIYIFSVLSRFTNVCMPCLPRSLRIHFFCKPLFNYLDHCNNLNWFCLNIFVLILFILLNNLSDHNNSPLIQSASWIKTRTLLLNFFLRQRHLGQFAYSCKSWKEKLLSMNYVPHSSFQLGTFQDLFPCRSVNSL